MQDNKTSQAAALYDANVHKTIPYYHKFHDEVLELVRVINPYPAAWLDTGCGTGTLIAKAAGSFDAVKFVAADPSAAMLELARTKLADLTVDYVQSGSEALSMLDKFDVISAIMAHHYLDSAGRAAATENCFAALKNGGIFVTFETIRPFSERGVAAGLERWRTHQLASGKSAEEVDKHIGRYGVELLPITIEDHLRLLRETGFSSVEILWASGLQAGFYAVK
jgi:tRNA (cmo5U34)-methyltransferase